MLNPAPEPVLLIVACGHQWPPPARSAPKRALQEAGPEALEVRDPIRGSCCPPCKHRANTSAIHNDPRCQIDKAIQNGTNHLAHHDTSCHTAVRVQIPATVRKPGEFVHSFPCL